jgi:hypothetical protein
MEAAGVNPSDTYLRLGMEGPYAAVPHLLPWLGLIFLIVGETYIYLFYLDIYILLLLLLVLLLLLLLFLLLLYIYY